MTSGVENICIDPSSLVSDEESYYASIESSAVVDERTYGPTDIQTNSLSPAYSGNQCTPDTYVDATDFTPIRFERDHNSPSPPLSLRGGGGELLSPPAQDSYTEVRRSDVPFAGYWRHFEDASIHPVQRGLAGAALPVMGPLTVVAGFLSSPFGCGGTTPRGGNGDGGFDFGDDDGGTDERTDVRANDSDNDGYPEDKDCDDNDATIHPRAEETPYDGIDQDCNGEDLIDADGDGFIAVEADGDDCNDDQAYIHPDTADFPAEQRMNGDDTDCDGTLRIRLDRDSVAFVGENDGDQAGSASAIADVNGDGWDDVIIGAPDHHINLDAGFEGKVYIFFGGEGRFRLGTTLMLADADVQMNGACNFALGSSILAKDLDGDGAAELFVGAPGYNNINCEPAYAAGDSSRSGAILVFKGRSDWDESYDFYEIDAWSAAEMSGLDIEVIKGRDRGAIGGAMGRRGQLLIDDIDGDGTGELIAGKDSSCDIVPAVFEAGIQNIADISTHRIYNQPDHPFNGDYCNYISSGDVDNDGLADLLLANISDEVHNGAGEDVLLFGSPSFPEAINLSTLSSYAGLNYFIFRGNGSGYGAGLASVIADADGDGMADVIIAVPREDSPFEDAGRVYVTPGSAMAEVKAGVHPIFGNGDEATLNGDVYDLGGISIHGDRAGAVLPFLGLAGVDTNDDGAEDLLLGAAFYGGTAKSGRTFFQDGASLFETEESELSVETADHVIEEASAIELGFNITGGGDANGDGVSDVLVYDRGGDSGSTTPGTTYLFLGGPR